MAGGSGRSIKVEALNERRVEAVKLRLAGVPLAQAAERSGLSQPTVIAAIKAYREGGWAAVPVAPRGRGVKKGSAPAYATSSNIKHFRPPATRELPPETVEPTAVPRALTHLQRLEAESIHIMREVVAESDQPGDALLDRQGQLGDAASGAEGVLPRARRRSR